MERKNREGKQMKQIDLTKGKVWQVLLKLALPLMGTSLLQFTYQLIDTLFVGHLGSNSVASVGSSSFFIGIGYALNAMIVIGAGIKVSHAVGRNEKGEVAAYIRAGMIFNALLGISYMLILLLFGKKLIGFLHLGNSQVEKEGYFYLAWSAPMLLLAFFNTLFARVLGSLGNTKTPLIVSMIGIVANIILDPLFIYTLKLGVVGAAIATLIANLLMFGYYIRLGRKLFTSDTITCDNITCDSIGGRFSVAEDGRRIKEMVALGWPMSYQRVLFTLINIVLARMIAQFGTEAIAAQKIGLQIESVVYMVTGGLNGAMASFTGQNYGACQPKRIQKGYKAALGLGMTYAFLSMIVFLTFSKQLAHLFVTDEKTIVMIVSYLSVIAYSQIFNAMEMISNGLFTGMGSPKIPARVSVIFTALRIPLAWLLSQRIGVQGIWWAISCSTMLKGMVLYVLYHLKGRQMIKNLGEIG